MRRQHRVNYSAFNSHLWPDLYKNKLHKIKVESKGK